MLKRVSIAFLVLLWYHFQVLGGLALSRGCDDSKLPCDKIDY